MPIFKRIEDYSEWTGIQCALESLSIGDVSQAAMEADIKEDLIPSKRNAKVLLTLITKTLWIMDDWYHTNTNQMAQFVKDVHGANGPAMVRISVQVAKLSEQINQLRKELKVSGITSKTESMIKESIVGLDHNIGTLLDQYEMLGKELYLPSEVCILFNKGDDVSERGENALHHISVQYHTIVKGDGAKYDLKTPAATKAVTSRISELEGDLDRSGSVGSTVYDVHRLMDGIITSLQRFRGGTADDQVDINRFLHISGTMQSLYMELKKPKQRLTRFSHDMRLFVDKGIILQNDQYVAMLTETNYLSRYLKLISMWYADYYDVFYAALRHVKQVR